MYSPNQEVCREKEPRMAKKSSGERLPRGVYEEELYRLQAELVKLQEWTRASGARIVVIFEGRDAAGKGGTIQPHHPVPQPPLRADRGAAQADRTGEHRVVLPAVRRAPAGGRRDYAVRPVLVQPGGRGARDGVLHEGAVRPVPAPVPHLRTAAGGRRHPAAQVLVLGQRRRAAAPVRSRLDDPLRQWKLSPMDLAVAHPLGGLLPRQGRHVHDDRHPGGARGTWSSPTTSGAPGST